MMFGWTGKTLRIDLTSRKTLIQPTPEYLRLQYLGGRGINSRILYEEVPSGIDPLGPENKLIFGLSPTTGTGLVNSGRCHATGKSPLTGILGDSNSGGHFGPELKWAGYDQVILEGKSAEPVFIWIDDENVNILSAAYIWGKLVPDTYRAIWDALGDPRIKIAAIGPAGENLIRYASIINDYGNAFGKTGMGAIMGSKNVKAIAVRGTQGVQVAEPEKFKNLARNITEKIKKSVTYENFSKYGTMSYLAYYNRMGVSVENNNQRVGEIEYIDNYSAEAMEKFSAGNVSCFGCPVHCKHRFKIKDGPYAGVEGFGTEFCIMSSHGPSCGQSDPRVVFKLNQMCNEFGICGDTSGAVLAAAFEWYQRGIIDKTDTEGVELIWGNAEAQIQMLEKIVKREGVGDLLAEGSAIAAKKLGKDADKCISHAKGADLDQVDIRTLKGCALSDAVSSRGADPQRGWPSHEVVMKPLKPELAKKLFGTDAGLDPNAYEGKGLSVAFYSALCTLCDTLGICKFNSTWTASAFGFTEMADLVKVVTGVEMNADDLVRVAARINNVERAFLVREGIRKKDDFIHGRVMDEPVPSGKNKGEVLDLAKFSEMLDEYYEAVGWDKDTGIPKRETLVELGLEDIAEDLEKIVSLDKGTS